MSAEKSHKGLTTLDNLSLRRQQLCFFPYKHKHMCGAPFS